MVRQRDIFLASEGNAWFERNKHRLGQRDPVSEAIEKAGIIPNNVLEIGCANGWRLARLRDKYGCEVTGIDPSLDACLEAARLGVSTYQATANNLPVRSRSYDLVIFGFCLYLTDPSDWFQIVAEADMVLRPGGHIVIHDFSIRDDGGEAFARPYKHRDDVMSYHADFPHLWLAHPLYHHERWDKPADGELVEIIHKSAFRLPVRP